MAWLGAAIGRKFVRKLVGEGVVGAEGRIWWVSGRRCGRSRLRAVGKMPWDCGSWVIGGLGGLGCLGGGLAMRVRLAWRVIGSRSLGVQIRVCGVVDRVVVRVGEASIVAGWGVACKGSGVALEEVESS
jgi:hypothetical protein